MSKKFIVYWFSALPFLVALRVTIFYVFNKIFGIPFNFYFSQTGEDILLSNILSDENGFYVDVGCNEPIEKSNTFLFYLRKWKGITIDANEDLIKKHRSIRKYDKAICAAISDVQQEVTFYKFNETAVSTIVEEYYKDNLEYYGACEKQTITTRTLTAILDENMPPHTTIDLLTIDVEGVDFEVLKSLDFNKYRPTIIVIEAHHFSLNNFKDHIVSKYLEQHGYELIWFATVNAYYKNIGMK